MIKTKDIIFRINDKQYIKIVMSCQDQIFFHRFDPVIISFHDQEKIYILSQHDYLGPEIEKLDCFFKEILQNNLNLFKEINKDIGYLYNEELYTISSANNEDTKIYEKITNFLVSSEGNYAVWLYTKEDLIFLQITPLYPWNFNGSKQNEKFISYDKFIKNYKSCLTVEIKKETMADWAAKSNEISQMIRDE